MLENTVLFFDKRNVSDDEILEHVKHYIALAEKGMSLNDKNKKESLNCLKLIRETMKLEYQYYNKSKVKDIIWKDEKYVIYKSYIDDAFVKQRNTNSYVTLFSNLYDVRDYAQYYYGRILREREGENNGIKINQRS